MHRPAVVLLSGGLDSATVLAIARHEGFDAHALTIRYGQRHAAELDAARRVASTVGVADHKVIDLDLRLFGGSALTADIPVPKNRPLLGDPKPAVTPDPRAAGTGPHAAPSPDAPSIPVTYVPARNTIFLSIALAWAEVLGSRDIFIGVNAVDYSGYPDCRPAFIAAFEKLAALATRAGAEQNLALQVHAPLIMLTKAEIIRRGVELGVDYGQTLTCYDADDAGRACGNCDACILRLKGFHEAGMPDPAPYRPAPD